MKITFNGAAKTVTGSCHLIETGNVKFLLDCGLFQGKEKVEELNRKFSFKPQEVDFVILSHGHLDHCGRLPFLVKKGFRGRIYATKGTIDIARLILMDAAQVMEENLKTENRRRLREGLPPKELLYTLDDVFDVFDFFVPIEYSRWYEVGNVKFRLRDAGHILCSSFVELEIEGKKILFSGDLGAENKPLIREPEIPEKSDVILIETTYGDREHKSYEESVKEFEEAVLETFKRGGVVLVPTFALERAQDVIYLLKKMYEKGKLPKCKIFVDSPLAISITRVFKRHKECLRENVRSGDIFDFPYLEFTRTVEESKRINEYGGACIIVAGNGMCTGGRILHHLKHRLWDKRNSIIFVGYQAEGTLGREIVEGAKKVKVFNERIAVKAEVFTINGFSSHAGRSGLLNWLRKGVKEESKVFLVHGEEKAAKSFATLVNSELGLQPIIPDIFASFSL